MSGSFAFWPLGLCGSGIALMKVSRLELEQVTESDPRLPFTFYQAGKGSQLAALAKQSLRPHSVSCHDFHLPSAETKHPGWGAGYATENRKSQISAKTTHSLGRTEPLGNLFWEPFLLIAVCLRCATIKGLKDFPFLLLLQVVLALSGSLHGFSTVSQTGFCPWRHLPHANGC